MGGAIAAKTAFYAEEIGERVAGLVVLDVLEGAALNSLPYMEGIVR